MIKIATTNEQQKDIGTEIFANTLFEQLEMEIKKISDKNQSSKLVQHLVKKLQAVEDDDESDDVEDSIVLSSAASSSSSSSAMEEEGELNFIDVKKNKKKRNREKNSNSEGEKTKITKKNGGYYDVISDSELTLADLRVQQNREKAEKNRRQQKEAILRKNNNNNYSITEEKQEEAKVNNGKKYRQPPIIVPKLDTNKFQKMITRRNPDTKYSVKITKNGTKILNSENAESRKVIFDLLKEQKVAGHTYTPKEEKNTAILVKAIHHTYAGMEIEDCIRRQIPDIDIIHIKNFETFRSRRDATPHDMFTIQLKTDQYLKELINLKYICNHVVVWEKLKRQDIMQCMKCQRIGHVARNCLYLERCVKCLDTHERGKCTRIKGEIEAQCVNCGQTGHPANYRGCPVYERVQHIRTQKRVQVKQQQEQWEAQRRFSMESAGRMVTGEASFAEIMGGARKGTYNNYQRNHDREYLINNSNNNDNSNNNNINNSNINNHIIHKEIFPAKSNLVYSIPAPQVDPGAIEGASDFITTEGERLFGCDLFTLMNKIKAFLPHYNKCSNESERTHAYLNFAFNLCK